MYLWERLALIAKGAPGETETVIFEIATSNLIIPQGFFTSVMKCSFTKIRRLQKGKTRETPIPVYAKTTKGLKEIPQC